MALSRVRMEVDPNNGMGRRVWVTLPGEIVETEVPASSVTIESSAYERTYVNLRLAAIVTVVPEGYLLVNPDKLAPAK